MEETTEKGEMVPVWCEKALCSLSADRLVTLRRAQTQRPEGFTGLCFFLCGSSVSTAATADHPAPEWCPLSPPNSTVKRGSELYKAMKKTKTFLAQTLISSFSHTQSLLL